MNTVRVLTRNQNMKNNQSELKNMITEMKNTLEGMNSRLGDIEECISDLEDRIIEITQSEEKKEKKNQNSFKGSLRQHQAYQHAHDKGARRRREREEG